MTHLLLEYDESVDAAYLTVSDYPWARQERLDDARAVNYAADGSVIGIELLSPRRKGVLVDGLPFDEDVARVLRTSGFDIRRHSRSPDSIEGPGSHPQVPLAGNKAIEDAAIAFVMRLELQAGRTPIDRRFEAAFPADIESPPRIVEVKAVGGIQRGWFVPLEAPQLNAARTNADFYLYIVDNVRQGDPAKYGIRVFSGDRLARLLDRATVEVFHREAAAGSWIRLSLMEQLGNVGTEVARAMRAKEAGNTARSANALRRALELFDLTIADDRWRGPTRRELCRAREVVCDYLAGDNVYRSTTETLDRYFLAFGLAARRSVAES